MSPGGTTEPVEQPLIEWLLHRHPDTPRTRAKQWIVAGRVSVDGQVVRRPQLVMPDPGASLELLDRRSTTLDCGTGWQIHPKVSLLFLDSALAVVNKGPGLISVPAPNADLSALSILQDFLEGRLRPRDRTVANKSLPAIYRRLTLLPVHRLDQYTTGAFCMACQETARSHLIEQLKAHTMKREYIAFAEGRAQAAKGTWRQWLDSTRDGLRQHIVSEAQANAPGSTAREAITHYEVLAEYKLKDGVFVSKLRLSLETGRKHQIRVQAAAAGLPLIGDRSYHTGYRLGVAREARLEFSRQALHAELLTLEHPDHAGRRLTWKAEWPADLRQLDNGLRPFRV